MIDARALSPQEQRQTWLAATWFFFLLGSYFVLRPLRDALGIERGPEALRWLFTATFVATLLVTPAYGWLVGKFARARLLPVVYHVAAASCVGFAVLLWLLPAGSLRIGVGYAFFVWLSVYNGFGLSAVFWAFLADVHSPAAGQRLFGFIAAGGTLGAVVGSAIASVVAGFGVSWALLVGAFGIELAVVCFRALARAHAEALRSSHAREQRQPVASLADAWRGARQVARSRYLAAIAACMAFDILTSTYLYAAQGDLAKRLLADANQRAQFFARVDLGTNALVFALEVCAVAPAMRRFGVGAVLAALPLASLAALHALAWAPALWVIGVVQVVRRGVEFGLTKPAREVLFTAVSRQEKYEAKAFIDTVVNRASDMCVLWALAWIGAGANVAVACAAVPVAAVWVWLSFALARAWQRRTQVETKGAAGAVGA